MNTSTNKQPEIYELCAAEIDDVAGAGWLRDAYNWVKKHVGAGHEKVTKKHKSAVARDGALVLLDCRNGQWPTFTPGNGLVLVRC